MNRRGFLGSILALAAAPAIVRADSLMRIVPVETVVQTFDHFQVVHSREDLADIIWDISPMETPFISSVGRDNKVARAALNRMGNAVMRRHYGRVDAEYQVLRELWRGKKQLEHEWTLDVLVAK